MQRDDSNGVPVRQTMASVSETAHAKDHSLATVIGLHLVPGVLTTIVYVALAPLTMAAGFPAVFTLLVAALLVVIPFELGYLFYQARVQHQTLSLNSVLAYRDPAAWWKYLLFPILLLVWAFLVSGLAAPIDLLAEGLFRPWLPDWMFLSSLDQFAVYEQSALLTTFVFGLVVNGFAGPIVEELYFRGYLLPRLAAFGRWAPVINVVLFSLYHFWTPWQNVSRILLMLPLVYLVWRTRNLYFGIIAHCLINIVGWCLTFALILGASR